MEERSCIATAFPTSLTECATAQLSASGKRDATVGISPTRYCLDSALRARVLVFCQIAGNTRLYVCCRDVLGQADYSIGLSSSQEDCCKPVDPPLLQLGSLSALWCNCWR